MVHVVTGGSGSGKSEYAEQMAVETGVFPRIYLATMRVWDEEGEKRVERHRAMRAQKGFITIERYTDLEHINLTECGSAECGSASHSVILLECMSNLTANEYYRQKGGAADAVMRGINHLQNRCGHLIIVTNEVFSDGESYGLETREYREILGAVNRYLGQIADTVTEVVYGIPIRFK